MILAIDQSLVETGVCFVSRDGGVTANTIKTTAKMPWLDRLTLILSSLDSSFLLGESKGSPIETVVMENYAYGGSTKGFVLGELGGVIKYHFGMKGFPVCQIIASHHKMYTARNGHATKTDTMTALRRRFAIDTDNDNVADAISMGLLMRHMILVNENAATASAYESNLFTKVRACFELQERNPEELERRRKERAAKRRRKDARGHDTGTEGSDPSDPFEIR